MNAIATQMQVGHGRLADLGGTRELTGLGLGVKYASWSGSRWGRKAGAAVCAAGWCVSEVAALPLCLGRLEQGGWAHGVTLTGRGVKLSCQTDWIWGSCKSRRVEQPCEGQLICWKWSFLKDAAECFGSCGRE